MATVVMHAVVSVDGYIADDNDDVGPLFEWYFNGDLDLVDGGPFKVSPASVGYVRPMWESIGSVVIGRHLFDLTNGWEGKPPAGEHVVVVSHRPKPDGWHPEASYYLFDDVAARSRKRRSLLANASLRSRPVTSVDRPLPWGSWTRWRWMSCLSCLVPARRTSGRSTPSSCWRTPTWRSGATGCFICGTGFAAEPSDRQLILASLSLEGHKVRDHDSTRAGRQPTTSPLTSRARASARRRCRSDGRPHEQRSAAPALSLRSHCRRWRRSPAGR